MKNAFFKLPFQFDEQKLLQDLNICLELQWKNHFNPQSYDGIWTSISLRSPSGNEKDILTYTTEKGYFDTPLLEKCVYFKKIIESFECPKESVRLLCLNPDSIIKEHSDYRLGYEYGFFRLHIPIITSAEISFKVGGNEIPMRVGECWYANFHLPHSVENKTQIQRIHLVIDCLQNNWSDKLFEQIGFDFSEAEIITQPDEKTVKFMIERLKQMDAPAAKKIIEKYENMYPSKIE